MDDAPRSIAGPSGSRVLVPVPPTKPSSLRRLADLAAAVPEAADLVLVGDSLAAAWPEEGARADDPDRVVFNFGLPGDRIQNALWRMDTVAIGHLHPSVVVIVVGTNNLGDGDPPAAIVAGLRAVLGRADALWASPTRVLVGLPWRRPGALGDSRRLVVNAALAALAVSGSLRFLDPDPVLGFGPATTVDMVAPDGLHLTPAAYRRLSKALSAALAR